MATNDDTILADELRELTKRWREEAVAFIDIERKHANDKADELEELIQSHE